MNYWVNDRLISVYEHFDKEIDLPEGLLSNNLYYEAFFPKTREDGQCFILKKNNSDKKARLKTGYFIGVDRIPGTDYCIYIAPKLNSKVEEGEELREEKNLVEVDYIKMLFETLSNPELFDDMQELFLIKWEEDEIDIKQKDDFLTPFLMVQFLGVLKAIVKKGVKKTYYRIEQNLNSKIKGKVMVDQSLKQNHYKHKYLSNVCQFEEFGINGIENRLLKKTLEFVKPYLSSHSGLVKNENVLDMLNFITPGFTQVSNEIELSEIRKIKINPFFKEYIQAIDLAKIILKRSGYNITNINKKENQIIKTPPFWIDMSKLFELYVLGLLRKELNEKVEFQFDGKGGNELDFVIGKGKDVIIADAKYKPWYKYSWNKKINDDLRQVSGYARLEHVRKEFQIADDVVPNCLIIYPNLENENKTLDMKDLRKITFENYKNIFKMGITIPLQNDKN